MYTKKDSVSTEYMLCSRQKLVVDNFTSEQLEKSMVEYPDWDPRREIEAFMEQLFPVLEAFPLGLNKEASIHVVIMKVWCKLIGFLCLCFHLIFRDVKNLEC